MKSQKLIFTLLIILIIASLFFYFSNHNSTIKKELRDFAVEDTASIDKIFMVNKFNQKVVLERTGVNEWKVNNKYKARVDAINMLLKTIKQVKVKMPISKSARQNIIKRMSSQSTKVEIYSKGKLIKKYYVGEATQDHSGTYMLLENSESPFITHIDGFTGFLTTRYFVEEKLWRVNSIFSYKNFSDIAKVKLYYPQDSTKSFTAEQLGYNKFKLLDYKGNNVKNFDTLSVKRYMSLFKKINYEAPIVNMRKTRLDTLNAMPFEQIFTVEDINGVKNTLKTKLVPNIDTTYDDKGNLKIDKYDLDRMYGFMNNGKEIVTVQYFVFDPLIKNISEFIKKQ